MANLDLAQIGKNLLKSTETGENVELQSLWQDQPVVLFFLRRFGCQVCRWMASEISKLEPDLRASSIALVGVGPEELGLTEFKERGFFKGSIYVDEQKKSYKDLGFKRYTALSVVPAALGKKVRDIAAKASAEGIQGNFSGDLLQSGGMLIVDKGGERVLLHFVQDSPGDHVPLEDISKTLGISAKVTAGQRPVENSTSRTKFLRGHGHYIPSPENWAVCPVIIRAFGMPITSSTWSSTPLPPGSVVHFPQQPPCQSYCNMYIRLPHDLSEDQQISSQQPRNRINLVFSDYQNVAETSASHKCNDDVCTR